MSVLAFLPSRPRHADPGTQLKDRAPAEVIAFPGSPKGLTQTDVDTLLALQRALGNGWFCEMHRDPDGELWGVIGSTRGRSAGDAFLIYRQATKVVFFRLDADGKQAVGIRRQGDREAKDLAALKLRRSVVTGTAGWNEHG